MIFTNNDDIPRNVYRTCAIIVLVSSRDGHVTLHVVCSVFTAGSRKTYRPLSETAAEYREGKKMEIAKYIKPTVQRFVECDQTENALKCRKLEVSLCRCVCACVTNTLVSPGGC